MEEGLGIRDWLPSLPKQKVLGQCSLISVLKNADLPRMGSRLANILIPSVLGVVEQNLRQPESLMVSDICHTHIFVFFMCSGVEKKSW